MIETLTLAEASAQCNLKMCKECKHLSLQPQSTSCTYDGHRIDECVIAITMLNTTP